MSGMTTGPTQQEKDFFESATELIGKVSTLGASVTGNPLIMAGVKLFANGIEGWAKRRGIDTGPFVVVKAALDATVERGIDAHEEYQARHADA
jgi:hypothetical protein